MSTAWVSVRDDDDVWDHLQWRVRDLLLTEHDPLFREALYRHGESCIRACGDGDADHRATRLRQFRIAYLLTAERGAAALS